MEAACNTGTKQEDLQLTSKMTDAFGMVPTLHRSGWCRWWPLFDAYFILLII